MKIYICDIKEFENLDGSNLLRPKRQEGIARYVQKKDKMRCLVSGLLEREILGITTDEQIRYGKYGKPYLIDSERYFNISHSGDYVILAVDEYEMGIDIEQVLKANKSVANKCFTVEENHILESDCSENLFFDIWAAKEGYIKAIATGFSLDPISFSVLPLKEGEHIIDGKSWYFYWGKIEGYGMCVVSEKEQKVVEYIQLQKKQLVS